MRYYLVAGEASGDLHGSLLIESLKKLDPNPEFRFIGGDLMAQAALKNPFRHLTSFAFMGFLEVVKNLGTILKNLSLVKKDILFEKPDALILIDFPGFNLRLAKAAHQAGIPVYYFISPKVWAWNAKRVLPIKRDVDHMLVIFPFEVPFYKEWGMDVDYVGNPLMDAISQFKNNPQPKLKLQKKSRPIISLLPGSRKQEIEKILPIMIQMVGRFPDYQFVLAGTPSLPEEYYLPYLIGLDIPIFFNQTYQILSQSALSLVTSGTATLETALLGIPEVVLYKTSKISFQIAKRVIRVPYICLVNLIMNKKVVTELIQDQCNPERLEMEVRKILPGGSEREVMLDAYEKLGEEVGGEGASKRAAEKIYHYMSSDGK